MSFLDHIARCNAHDLSKFVPLIVDGKSPVISEGSSGSSGTVSRRFQPSDEAVRLADGLETYDDRTAAIEMVVRFLFENGALTGWRGEPYPVGGNWGGPHAFEIERAASPFSVRVPTGSISMVSCAAKMVSIMWIARRADDRPGLPRHARQHDRRRPAGDVEPKENVIKEAGEEAGVAPELAATAIPTGAVTYCAESEVGLKPDMMFSGIWNCRRISHR